MIKKLPSTYRLFSIENFIGILLAVLILFDLKIEQPIINLLNTPIGIIFSIIFVIILFICLNPLIGILFLIYLFLNIQQSTNHNYNKTKIMERMNVPLNTQLEEDIIAMRAPLK